MRKHVLLPMFLVVCLLLAGVTATAEDVIRIYWQGQPVQTDVPPQIINGRVMVPIRAVTEIVGNTVTWSQANRAVYINPPQVPSEPQITADAELIRSIKDAMLFLKNRNLDAYYFICRNLKEIKTSYKYDFVAWEENGICYFNPNKCRGMDTLGMSLALCHEAAHVPLGIAGFKTAFTYDDSEHIAYLYTYRVANQLGDDRYTADIVNRMLKSLHP